MRGRSKRAFRALRVWAVTVHGRPRLRRAETLALTLLASGGIAAIWRLNEAAAQAYRTGHAWYSRGHFAGGRSRRGSVAKGRGSARGGGLVGWSQCRGRGGAALDVLGQPSIE